VSEIDSAPMRISRSVIPGSGLAQPNSRVRGFRTKLLVAIMFVVTAVTALVLYVAQRNLAANTERELHAEFQSDLAGWHNAQDIRHAALVERCRALVRKPRIHAALEDDALDLLYPSSEDELRDLMAPRSDDASEKNSILRARFYRFLGPTGRLIPAPESAPAGRLDAAVESQLPLPKLDASPQLGYIPNGDGGTSEIIATPIISTETGGVIASLVLGFKPLEVGLNPAVRRGLVTGGHLYLAESPKPVLAQIEHALLPVVTSLDEGSRTMDVAGVPHLIFFKRLNPGSLYPPAYEVSLYSLESFQARAAQLRLQVIGIGVLLLAGAYFASHVLAGRLSAPVERLAEDSERSARFSADASHQLKTPVTVLRAGLEELLTRDNLTPDECNAIAALIHQTYRLSSLIEDLLLLSRMDAGRLRLALKPVDLSHLIAAALDDLGATPDAMELKLETDVPESLFVSGEQRYTAIILQNLLENARKYNRPGGRIRIAARVEGDSVLMSVGNTGRAIAPAAQANIFERFHRGAIGENVPGYGLGLNLGRELARLHLGDLRLVRSGDDWTEFELWLRVAQPQLVSV
jgi:signal transduction histidine kinase